MKVHKILEKLGLNPKQASVYGATLELGHGSAQTIAIKAELPKSTTYDILKSLTHRGLVSVYLKGKKHYYAANDPGILEDKIKEQAKIVTKLLPNLQTLYNNRDYKPKVRFYEGKQGVRIIIEEILKEAHNLTSIGSAEDIFNKLSDYFPEFPIERAKKKIPIRVILRSSPTALERKKSGPRQLRQVKIIKTGKPFNSLIWLWRSKIALITLKEDLSVTVVESQELTTTIKALFELVWNCRCQHKLS